MNTLKVGELAARTGLTVRTLHHYDEIGLLSPARRSPAGHRLYGAAEVERLQQIRSLQQLGLTLDEIGELLGRREITPQRVIRMQLERARDQLDRLRELVARLERIAERLESARPPSTEDFLQTVEAMTMYDSYYTPEQMEYLKQRRAEVGEERIRAVQQEWADLYEEARIELEKGTDPADAAAQRLVRRSRALIAEFTGGDEGIRASLADMWRNEPGVRRQYGPPPEVGEFLAAAGRIADDADTGRAAGAADAD